MIANAEKPQSRAKEKPKVYVKTATIEYADIHTLVKESGRLASQRIVDLSAEVSGRLLKGDVNLKEGTSFKKGDLLVKIFDEEAAYNLKAAKSRFLNSIAGILPDMKIDYPESYEKWYKFFNEVDINKQLPELPGFDSEKEKVFLASRNILNDYYSIQSSQTRLSRYKMYAPFDGSFTAVMLEAGSVANPGVRIASMIKTDVLELEVPFRVEDIDWIKKGDEAKITNAEGKFVCKGKVVRIADFVDPTSQTISAFIELNPKNTSVYQGQFLEAEFDNKIIEKAFSIPRNAIFNKNKVYLIDDNKLKIGSINIHKLNETTAVISGPENGSQIVIEPLINAAEGMGVEILN